MKKTFYETLESDKERSDFVQWLRGLLIFGPTTVVFKKKDGTERKMLCTLNPTMVKEYEKKTERTKTVSEETCPVYDLDKQEWRSFRYDSVIEVRFK